MRSRGFLAGVVVAVSTACAPQVPEQSPNVLEVRANEYAFIAPDSVDAGRTLVRLRNDGKVLHEMIVFAVRPGVSLDSVVKTYRAGAPFRPVVDGGNAVLFAPPQRTGSGELVVDFAPGRDYVLWCNFTDGPGKPEHATLGMFKAIHVRPNRQVAPLPPATTVVVTSHDYAFQTPDSVAPGVADIVLRQSGAQRHELALSLLRRGTSAATFLSEYQKGNSLDSLYDDDGAILTASAGDTNRTALRVTFEPGRTWVLVCEFRDGPDAPKHVDLGMFKALYVKGTTGTP